MATKTNDRQLPAETKEERKAIYTPLGETSEIELTIPLVRNFIAAKTKSGKTPPDEQIVKFIMLCKARELNPWVGDAYLVGFDSNDGPQFQLITAIQALFKRAELNPNYDGIESGVTVLTADGDIQDREGAFTLPQEGLVGGWARCHRKDQKTPCFARLKLETYSTGRSRWKSDPAGMIQKCSEAAVLRKAFPNSLGGLYVHEEMRQSLATTAPAPPRIDPPRRQAGNQGSASDRLAEQLGGSEQLGAGEESQDVNPLSGEENQENKN